MRAVVLFLIGFLSAAGAQDLLRQEISTNFAPPELLRPAVQTALSPQGRFVILPEKGRMLVIDYPSNVENAKAAIANLDAPPAQVRLDLGLRTGGQLRAPASNPRTLGPVRSRSDFPFPTAFDPPRILVGPNGTYAVIPAHPKNFQRRNVGVTMETKASVNPDGSINVSINHENVEFEGFINYGSPILALGNAGILPLMNQSPNPLFFAPFIAENKILQPIFSTTRITTSLVVYPELVDDFLRVHLMPQLTVTEAKNEWEELPIQLRQFRTAIDLESGVATPLNGLTDAPEAFNAEFFGSSEELSGLTQIVIKAKISPATIPKEAP